MSAFIAGHRSLRPTPRTARPAALAALVTLAALGACSADEVIDPPFRDTIAPRVQVAKSNTVADTLLSLTVNATDNIGLKRVRVLLAGGISATYDTVMTSAVTSLTVNVHIRVPNNAPLGATVNARAIATDGAGNQSDTARVALTVGNLEPPQAIVTSPVTRDFPLRQGTVHSQHARLRDHWRVQREGLRILCQSVARFGGGTRHPRRAG